MKRFKIIACFLLMFSLTFSIENQEGVDYRQKYNEEQQYSKFLEEKVATYERVLGKYEKLEEKLNDKLLESASQNYNVDQFYTSAWDKLQAETEYKLSIFNDQVEFIKWIIGIAFAFIGFVLPLYQKFFITDKAFEKIGEYEKKLDKQQESIEKQMGIIKKQEREIEESQKILKEQEKKFFDEMGEAYFLMILNSIAFLEETDKEQLLKTTLDCFERIIKCYIKTSNPERLSAILSGLLILKNDSFDDIERKEDIMKEALKGVKISLEQFNEVFDSDKMEWDEAKQKEIKEVFGLV